MGWGPRSYILNNPLQENLRLGCRSGALRERIEKFEIRESSDPGGGKGARSGVCFQRTPPSTLSLAPPPRTQQWGGPPERP